MKKLTFGELKRMYNNGELDTRCSTECGCCQGCDTYNALGNYLNHNPESINDQEVVPERVIEYYELPF